MDSDTKTTKAHWNEVWAVTPRMRLPSGMHIGVRNLQQLLRRHVRRGSSFLEIGCAPGKLLAWVAVELGASVSGLDYSPRGIDMAECLFETLRIPGNLRCEDVFATSFSANRFDYVFSAGVIEHFDDPSRIVARHVSLLKPGGLAIITVPNYGGWYGAFQKRVDPANLAIHNTAIMSIAALRALVPEAGVAQVRAYPAGRFSPWLITWNRMLPRPLATLAVYGGNLLGLLQPVRVASLCPMLVLEIRRAAP